MTAAQTPPGRGVACPYLGLIDDPATHLAYPSTAQVCHALGRPTAADHVKQAQDCLTADHVRCPRYRPVAEPAPPGRLLRAAIAGPDAAPGRNAVPPRRAVVSVTGDATSSTSLAVREAGSTLPAIRSSVAAPAVVAPARVTAAVRPGTATRKPPNARRVVELALFGVLLVIVLAGGLYFGSRLAEQMGTTPDASIPVAGASTTPSIAVSPAPATATPSVTPSATTAPTSTPIPSPTRTPAPTRRPAPTPTTHLVKAGETLTQIAGLYGLTVQALQTANNLTDPNLILTGQTLIIPVP